MKHSGQPPSQRSWRERIQKRYITPLIQDTQALFQNLASGDQSWARFRLIFALLASIILVVFLFVLVDVIFRPSPQPAATSTSPPQITLTPTITPTSLPTPMFTPTPGTGEKVVGIIQDEIRKLPSRSRYLYAPFIVTLIVLLYGARYIQDVYELKEYENALRYFMSSIFGFPEYERLVIAEGKKKLTPDAENTLDIIGGPGYVVIAPGNAALFERLTGPAAVRPAGRHFISRFERIAAIVNLEEQIGEISCKSDTKDGIPVEARNVRFRYRICPGKRFSGPAGRAMVDPYPFSKKAIVDMAYSRNVQANGLMSWDVAVSKVVSGAIAGYIAKNTLDSLLSPALTGSPQNNLTRDIIQKSLFSAGTRNSFRNLGAELLFCDIGHFAINDKNLEEIIRSRLINTWKAHWMGVANKMRSDAEARHQAFQDLGRAEVQAEMLMSIAHALEDTGLNQSQGLENLDNIILMRTAQIIDALSEKNE